MKKLTSKQFVKEQLSFDRVHQGSMFLVEQGDFALSTIRKAINACGYSAKVDEYGDIFAIA